MRDNVADSILSKINKRVEAVSRRLSKQYEGVKPFDSKQVSVKKQLDIYSQLTPEDMYFFMGKYGEDVVNNYIQNMEELKARRLGYGG